MPSILVSNHSSLSKSVVRQGGTDAHKPSPPVSRDLAALYGSVGQSRAAYVSASDVQRSCSIRFAVEMECMDPTFTVADAARATLGP